MPAIYLHMPFCKQKCTYCDFNSYPGLDAVHAPYIDAVIAEVQSRATCVSDAVVETVYIGGGTPTLLDPAHITRVLAALRREFTLAGDAEVSIEANPETVTVDKLAALKKAGVNRLSIGFQSLDDTLLELLGRKHTARRAVDAYRDARAAGFDNIGLDLIFGIPGQSLADWALTLEQAAALGPEHLSCYGLTVEPGTAIERAVKSGALAAPDEDVQADMLLYAMESLDEAGFEHYEVSNYARPGRACRHNLTYWDGGDYLGLGAGAHSKEGATRSCNIADPAAYIEHAAGDRRVAETTRLSLDDEMQEALFLGLRKLDGVDRTRFYARFGRAVESVFGSALDELASQGLLVNGERLRLTRRGVLLGNEVFSRFV